ncbi:MAG: hypothetical protein L3J47_11440, partial [Sulfurovum sp.]|nr:hypothetical protein [Sulfurovum sp.]
DERDREVVASDPHSKIVEEPSDMTSKVVIRLFFHIPFRYEQGRLVGFEYLPLKDMLKWHNCKPKHFVPIMLSCMNYYIKGLNSKT